MKPINEFKHQIEQICNKLSAATGFNFEDRRNNLEGSLNGVLTQTQNYDQTKKVESALKALNTVVYEKREFEGVPGSYFIINQCDEAWVKSLAVPDVKASREIGFFAGAGAASYFADEQKGLDIGVVQFDNDIKKYQPTMDELKQLKPYLKMDMKKAQENLRDFIKGMIENAEKRSLWSYQMSKIVSAIHNGNVILLNCIYKYPLPGNDDCYSVNKKTLASNHHCEYPFVIALKYGPIEVVNYYLEVHKEKLNDVTCKNLKSESGESLFKILLDTEKDKIEKIEILRAANIITEDQKQNLLATLAYRDRMNNGAGADAVPSVIRHS